MPPGVRYRALISYSHTDKSVAAWLHRAIEMYRVPARLVGRPTSVGPVPGVPATAAGPYHAEESNAARPASMKVGASRETCGVPVSMISAAFNDRNITDRRMW